MKKNKKRILKFVAITVIVLGGLLFFSVKNFQAETRTFLGTVESTSDSSISVRWFPVGQGINPDEFSSNDISEFSVSGRTVFIRESGDYVLRIKEGSDKTPTVEDVHRERMNVDFDQFKNEAASRRIFAKAFTKTSFFGRENFVAYAVYYNSDNIMFAPY